MNGDDKPGYQPDKFIGLLIAIIEAAHRDANKANVPEHERQEANEFIQWARELAAEDTPRFLSV